MNAPRLNEIPASLVPGLPSGARAFRVVQGGWAGGRAYVAGEVLGCEALVPGHRVAVQTVLVPKGYGRPCLGTVCAERLFGEAGEPCASERWSAAGRLVGVWAATGSASLSPQVMWPAPVVPEVAAVGARAAARQAAPAGRQAGAVPRQAAQAAQLRLFAA